MNIYQGILHVNTMERWPVALGNSANLLKAVGPERCRLKILANGQAVIAFEDSPFLATMEELAGQGIAFLACRNSLRTMRQEGKITLDEGELPDFVQVVPAGIAALIEYQAQGFAYVKP